MLRWAIILSFVLACQFCSAAEFFCAPDSYKFKHDGTVLEFGSKAPGKLAEGNAVWSRSKNLVTLAGARNETVAFQVVVQGPAKDVSIASGGFTGEGGATIEAGRVSVALIGFVESRDAGGPFPDVCIPIEKVGGKFDVPYSIKGFGDAPGQSVGLAIVEVSIPADAKAGQYHGSLKLSGGVTADLRMELTVWNFTMPAQPSIIFDVNSYGSPVGELGLKDHRNPYAPAPKDVIEAEHAFYRMFNRHRMYLNIMPVHSQRGAPYYTPMLKGDGKDTKCDWKHWDERFGPVLSGEIFDDKQPPPCFYLPFNLHWPYGYSHDEKMADQRINFRKNPKDYKASLVPAYEETFEAVAKQYIEHFAEKKWTQTAFQVYLNHTNAENANSPWRLDEPYDKYGFAVLQWYAKLTNKYMRDNDRGVKVRYRIDIGHWNCRDPKCQCYKPKQWEPDDGEGMLEPHIDHWYIGTVHTYGAKHKLPKLLAKGPYKEAYIYGGGDLIGGVSTRQRGLFWTLHDLGNRGFCAWKVGTAPATGGKELNGGDSVCYSGTALGFAEPLPSMRMKQWRRGSYDAEYIKLAAAKDAARTQEVVRAFVSYKQIPGDKYVVVEYPHTLNNPADYDLARVELAGLILGTDLLKGRKRSGAIDGPPDVFVDQITGY